MNVLLNRLRVKIEEKLGIDTWNLSSNDNLNEKRIMLRLMTMEEGVVLSQNGDILMDGGWGGWWVRGIFDGSGGSGEEGRCYVDGGRGS